MYLQKKKKMYLSTCNSTFALKLLKTSKALPFMKVIKYRCQFQMVVVNIPHISVRINSKTFEKKIGFIFSEIDLFSFYAIHIIFKI